MLPKQQNRFKATMLGKFDIAISRPKLCELQKDKLVKERKWRKLKKKETEQNKIK